ncbi:MAG: RNA polymerase sigma-70 factor (ECF subfamily) [Gammaproteobacteria bacterium]|jgi:RNA polymerase sigma-70 factor (ECF subfamily)
MHTMTSEDELAMRAATGDAEAFQSLLEGHYDRIFRLAYRFFGNQSDAEDLTQDVCLALPKKLKSFAARARFSTWIYQVVLNACRDQLRSQSSRRSLDEAYGEVSEFNKAAERETQEQIKWLYSALDSLNLQLRETAILVLAEDMTHAQAAEILDIKEKTVSWRMHEIRKQLKVLAESSDGEFE